MRRAWDFWLLIALALIFVLLLCGCSNTVEPNLHEVFGQKMMDVPTGTRIGSVTTEDEGMYFQRGVPADILILPPGTLEQMERLEESIEARKI